MKQLMIEAFELKRKGYYKQAIELFYKMLDKENDNIENNQGSSEVLISDTLQTNPEINDTSAGNLHATTDTLKQDSVETLNNVFPSESSEQVNNQDESLEILNKPNLSTR